MLSCFVKSEPKPFYWNHQLGFTPFFYHSTHQTSNINICWIHRTCLVQDYNNLRDRNLKSRLRNLLDNHCSKWMASGKTLSTNISKGSLYSFGSNVLRIGMKIHLPALCCIANYNGKMFLHWHSTIFNDEEKASVCIWGKSFYH